MAKEKCIIALDPGTTETGICIMRKSDYKPLLAKKIGNREVIKTLREPNANWEIDVVCIEMFASFGAIVGRNVFESCTWLGRFVQVCLDMGYKVHQIYRKDEKMWICGTMKGNDSLIRHNLVDRFAYDTSNLGKGTKKEPGWFYGFRADIWSAYAIGVTYLDMENHDLLTFIIDPMRAEE